jgi:cytochrome c6
MQRFWFAGMTAIWICIMALGCPTAAIALPVSGGIAQILPSLESPVAIAPVSSAVDAPRLFEQNCAGCHLGGGNIIRRGKNLKAKALQRYGMDSQVAIANLITNGKGNMSAYGEAAQFGAPTRLTVAEIEALADYVLAQAAADWQ